MRSLGSRSDIGGGRSGNPYFKSVLAERWRNWKSVGSTPKFCVWKGWLLARKGDLESAERSYIASLDWARQQQAKSWELRTATSYVRLMRDQARNKGAYELLAPIYAWFTEGFGIKDLRDAQALLDELRALTG